MATRVKEPPSKNGMRIAKSINKLAEKDLDTDDYLVEVARLVDRELAKAVAKPE